MAGCVPPVATTSNKSRSPTSAFVERPEIRNSCPERYRTAVARYVEANGLGTTVNTPVRSSVILGRVRRVQLTWRYPAYVREARKPSDAVQLKNSNVLRFVEKFYFVVSTTVKRYATRPTASPVAYYCRKVSTVLPFMSYPSFKSESN